MKATANVTIDKDIPIPPKRRARYMSGKWRYPLPIMAIGDSFQWPNSSIANASSTAHYGNKVLKPKHFIVRRDDHGIARLWRDK